MAHGKLFEFAVIYHPRPTKEQRENGETAKSVLVQEPITVLAATQAEVSILAARAIPQGYTDRLEDVEIVVRPF